MGTCVHFKSMLFFSLVLPGRRVTISSSTMFGSVQPVHRGIVSRHALHGMRGLAWSSRMVLSQATPFGWIIANSYILLNVSV